MLSISRTNHQFLYCMYHMLITSLTTHVIFCTLRWLETLLMFAASFYVTWMIFAALYYLICWYHGDLLPEHLPGKQEESNWKPCVFEMEDFASAFLFSLVSLKIQCRYFKEPDKMYLQSCCWSKLFTRYYIFKGNATYDRVWKQTNNKRVHGGHHCHVTPKCNWMSLSSIYGRIGICKTSKTTNKVITL